MSGQRYKRDFAPTLGLDYAYTWDGRDGFGRKVNGAQVATIQIDYVYNLIEYLQPADFARAWARPGLARMRERSNEMRLSQSMTTTLGSLEQPPDELGGWTLSAHHQYDPVSRVLYLGDGRRRSADNVGLVAQRFAGQIGDPEDTTGDGGPARDATMGYPEDVAVGPDGSVYFTDSNNARIRKIDTNGIISTVAGTGDFRDYGSPAGDGGPATEAELEYPYGLDVASDGSVYFTDFRRVRKIDTDGIITTVAGHEDDFATDPTFGGDGGPATDAHFRFAEAVAVAPDGSFYVTDSFDDRVRHVGTDGIIETIAGTGTTGFSGDGGPATAAQLYAPTAVEIGPDGSVYVADGGNDRVRRIGTDGIIETIAGGGRQSQDGVPATESAVYPIGIAVTSNGTVFLADAVSVYLIDGDGVIRKVAGEPCNGSCPLGSGPPDGTLAGSADLGCPWGVAPGHSGDIYVTDLCGHTIRRLEPALPDGNTGDIAVPSEDGSELYEFSPEGRHLRTLDTLTGETTYSFSYDGDRRLAAIEDADGLVTTIERNVAGAPTAIVSPFGRRTGLGLGSGGYLESLVNPANEETVFGYGEGGLLASLTTADGHTTNFSYDGAGRLIRDADAAGGFKELVRVASDDRSKVTLTTKLGRASKYEVERLPDDAVRRVWTNSSGFERSLLMHGDGKSEATSPDGVTVEADIGADPRFGAQVPVSARRTTETPGGRRMEVQTSREVVLTDPGHPLSLTTLEDVVSVNGLETTTVFDSALSRFTFTSPEGRTATTTVDSQRRPISSATAGLAPVAYARDSYGRVEQIAQGARTVDFAYDSLGRLETVTDADDREHRFEYDAADRVVTEVLPDLREIGFGYDDDGNVTSITPPSRPSHDFAHTPVGLTESYTPPELGSGPQPTTFDWNDDHDLSRITKPGGREIEFGYDAGGRLDRIDHSGGETAYAYDAQTGNLASAVTADNEQISFTWDGLLPLSETSAGTVAGEVSRTFDNDFQVVSESINGSHTAAFDYDDDGALTQAGGLTLDRDPNNGLLVGAEQGVITTDVDRDAFGDPERVGSVTGATVLYEEEYERDDLGRIVEKVERRGTQATIYEYGYDVGGRLETVTKDGALAATYSYDANGNRVGVDRAGEMPIVGQYDAQDRLTNYGTTTYTHDPAGQLASKTEGSDTTFYDYDDLGALRGVTLPNGDEIDYAVDASGRRVAKKVDGVFTQGFLYGRGLGPVAELDGSGSVRSRFVYGTRPNVPEYMVRGGHTYRMLVDQLGSPRAIVDVSTGVVAQQMDFDEFGRVTQDTNPGFQPFGFAGGLYDADTGLVRFGARDYDPETGRWTAKDPIGFEGGDANLYGYVVGDPVNFLDSSGLFLSSVGGVIDAVMPDQLSNAAAGALDTITLGMASRAFGVEGDCWGPGYSTGAFGGGFVPLFGQVGRARSGIQWAWKQRLQLGRDGAVSRIGRETVDGQTISVVHQVHRDNRLIHQHQSHIGKHRTEREFPNEWIEYPDFGR